MPLLRSLRIPAFAALAPLAAACSVVLDPHGGEWLSPIARDHPLAGVIWDAAARRPLARAVLMERLAGSQVVLLGDKHDNPDHHRLQAEVVAALIPRRRPAVVFEPISLDRRVALATALADPAPSAEGVIAAVAHDGQGWDWKLYEPIVDLALRAGLPIVAGDLDPAWVRAMRRDGLRALDAALIERLGLNEPLLGPAARVAIAAEIRRDHCGHAPEAMLDRLVDMQRARDAQLGRAIADALTAGADGAVLIAGVGHVHRDLAVPLDLGRWAPAATLASVAFTEVPPGRTDASAVLAEEFGDHIPFDYVWFTPRVDLTDPCEQFRSQLERMHSGHARTP